MSTDEELSKEEEQEKLATETNSGLMRSLWPEYPGYIQFPHPFMLHHVSAWWSMAIEKNKNVPKDSYEFHQNQWHAYRHLLTEFDGWHIQNIPVGDVKEDRVPAILVSYALTLGERYVLNQLSPKITGVLRTHL